MELILVRLQFYFQLTITMNKQAASKQIVSNPNQQKKGKKRKQYITCCVVDNILNQILIALSKQISRVNIKRKKHKQLMVLGRQDFQITMNQLLFPLSVAEPKQSTLNIDEMPKNVTPDSLSSSGMDKLVVEKPKSHVNLSRIKKQISMSDSKILKKITREPSIQLPLETIEEAKFVKDYREKIIKDEQEKRKQLQLNQKERLKRQKQSKSQSNLSINFDYNGAIIPSKNIYQGNLVHKILDQKFKNQRITRKIGAPPHPESVSPIEKQKYIKKNKSKLQFEQFNEFLDSQSLAESVQINRGIAYSHNSLLFTEKKISLPAIQLKNLMGKRRMSKDELQKIKQVDKKGSMQKNTKAKTQHFKQSNFSHKRSLSQANFRQNSFRKRQRINIINPELRSSMLIRLSDYESFLVLEKQFPDDPSRYYDRNQMEDTSSIQDQIKNQVETQSRISQSVVMTPKLPPVKPKILNHFDNEDMVLTRLQRQLQNKLRI